MPSGGRSALRYREVLRPRWWFWLMPAAFAAALGIAYGYAYGAGAGWLVGLATGALLLTWLGLVLPTRIEVDADVFRAGRAALPLRFVGRVEPLSAEQAFRARTTSADPRAWLLLRTWASATAVVVEVVDPADPHPYWLVSSRRPTQLADALRQARESAAEQIRGTRGPQPSDPAA